MALQALSRKAELEGDVDFLRESLRVLAQEVMELEVAQHLGAERYDAPPSARASAMVIASGPGIHG
jgi:transposase-like protein